MMDREEDVLPVSWKYYIAIMAVSCYQNTYLIKILEEQFLLNGGHTDWLIEGLKKVDKKLQNLGEFNEILAFKPWSLSYDHIDVLIRGTDHQQDPSPSNTASVSWTVP